MMWRAALLAGLFALMTPASSAGAAAGQGGSVSLEDWAQYKTRFLDPGGRIIDDANGNVSHSEGQGYGLLLSVLADNPPDFALIWSFTRRELLLRDDGLAAWKWSPSERPHVIDINNATDGDILIAYALVLAGERWKRQDYLQAASRIAKALLDNTLLDHGGRTLLLPGVSGFGVTERADGPVVNPSYWIFEAFPALDRVAPSPRWKKLSDDGLALLNAVQLGPRKLAADWVSLKTMPKPAQGFPAEYGYNALRIPLYLARADMGGRDLMARLRQGTAGDGDALVLSDVSTGAVQTNLTDPGYRFVNHILACVLDRAVIPDSVKVFSPTQYYPSTLHLLGLSYVKEKRPECL
ncbi:glycosyl hydrolase family 8 [Ensifer sp. MJa1]|uniref:glycosyl hydrolase family 8 n=1 Tax=Ensifer sp. MJa1 TaxID=2919888 RepID=UPI003008FDDD